MRRAVRAAALCSAGLLAPSAWAAGVDWPWPFLSRYQARDRLCERMQVEPAARQFPGRVRPEGPRGDFMERDVLVCRQRLMRAGLRSARDEAILEGLQPRVAALTGQTLSTTSALADRTWLVEVHYPSGPVSGKMRFAAQNELLQRGLRVSDRMPRLGVADVTAVTRLDPDAAFAEACSRYAANGSVGPQHALLTVLVRDLQQTQLQATVCADGALTWLR